MPVICVFGDSTAWGAWDLDKGGWVNRLWLQATSDQETEIYNLSISGGTTETILARFELEAKVREANVLVFQTGGNDAAYDKDTEEKMVPVEKFEANLENIISKSKAITKRIVFVGFKNCDETKTLPVSWCNLCYTNSSIKEYNAIMKKVCDKHGIEFVDIFGLLENTDFADGLHPNSQGHQKIYDAVKLPIFSA